VAGAAAGAVVAAAPIVVTERARVVPPPRPRELPGAQSVRNSPCATVTRPTPQSVAHALQGRVARAADHSVLPAQVPRRGQHRCRVAAECGQHTTGGPAEERRVARRTEPATLCQCGGYRRRRVQCTLCAVFAIARA
jgi:hypothetical protein